MARRKQARKVDTASSRSTASIFQSIDSVEQLAEGESIENNSEPQVPVQEESDKPLDYRFPFNLIFELQDFLNAYLTFCRGAEVLVCLFLCQIFYFYLNERNDQSGLAAVGYSIAGAVLAMYLSNRSLRKKHEADPENVAAPQLPEFNVIYAFLIPTALSVLLGGTDSLFFQMNMAINNFCIQTLHPVAKVASSFIFYYMYNEDNQLEWYDYLQAVWVYFSVEWALSYWNEDADESEDSSDSKDANVVRRTLSATDIHLIAVFFVNILLNFHLQLSESNVPLFILRSLMIALVGASAALFPVYHFYAMMSNPVLANMAAAAVAAVFSGVFYFLTNYIFTSQVIDEEVISWLYNYILSSELRVKLLSVWVAAMAITVPTVFVLAEYNLISLNIRRKSWHYILFASLAYPAMIKEPVFTAIAVLGSVFVFIGFEYVRASRLGMLGSFLDARLRHFQDEKDTLGPLSLSYIYLLVGVAIPISYGLAVDDIVSIRSYIGLVTLGLSDSTASIVGKALGKIKWKGGDRTVEGTVTYIVVTFASFVLIDAYLLPDGAKVKNWENVFIVSILGGIVEGASTMNDNVLVPSMSLIAYEVLSGVF